MSEMRPKVAQVKPTSCLCHGCKVHRWYGLLAYRKKMGVPLKGMPPKPTPVSREIDWSRPYPCPCARCKNVARRTMQRKKSAKWTPPPELM